MNDKIVSAIEKATEDIISSCQTADSIGWICLKCGEVGYGSDDGCNRCGWERPADKRSILLEEERRILDIIKEHFFPQYKGTREIVCIPQGNLRLPYNLLIHIPQAEYEKLFFDEEKLKKSLESLFAKHFEEIKSQIRIKFRILKSAQDNLDEN